MTAVAADGESGWNFDGAVWGVGENAGGGAVAGLHETGGLPAHAQREGWEAGCFR